MERLRGMLNVFQLMAEELGRNIEVSSGEINELAQSIASRIATIGEKYEKMNIDVDRETLLIKIYIETLETEMAENEWKDLFSRIGGLAHIKTSP